MHSKLRVHLLGLAAVQGALSSAGCLSSEPAVSIHGGIGACVACLPPVAMAPWRTHVWTHWKAVVKSRFVAENRCLIDGWMNVLYGCSILWNCTAAAMKRVQNKLHSRYKNVKINLCTSTRADVPTTVKLTKVFAPLCRKLLMFRTPHQGKKLPLIKFQRCLWFKGEKCEKVPTEQHCKN